jgi:hypothetical protein
MSLKNSNDTIGNRTLRPSGLQHHRVPPSKSSTYFFITTVMQFIACLTTMMQLHAFCRRSARTTQDPSIYHVNKHVVFLRSWLLTFIGFKRLNNWIESTSISFPPPRFCVLLCFVSVSIFVFDPVSLLPLSTRPISSDVLQG